MRKQITLLFILFMLSLLCMGLLCCVKKSPINQKMIQAEAIMDSHPDSSLLLMEDINPSLFKTDKDRAKYALLMTRAQDKNYINVVSDSLISTAVKYYGKTGDNYHLMLSLYYYGMVKLNAGDYANAIVSAHKAIEYGKELNDDFWTGLSYRIIADAYHATYNNKEKVAYAKQEYLYTRQSGRQPYIDYAMLDLAIAYNNDMDWDNALALCNQILDSATLHNDNQLLVDAKRVLGISNYGKNNYRHFLSAFQNICSSGISDSGDSANLSLAYVETGEVQKAATILNKIKPDTTLENQILHSNIRYKIYKRQNMDRMALSELEKVDSLLNAVMQKKISQNVNQSVINYLDSERQIAENDRNTSRKITWLIIIVFTLLFVILIILGRTHYNHQQEKLSKHIDAARQLQKLLSNVKSSYSKMQDDYSKIQIDYSRIQNKYSQVQDNYSKVQNEYSKVKEDYTNVQNDYSKVKDDYTHVQNDYQRMKGDYSKARSSVKTLLSERYDTLDKLCTLMYENSNESITKKRIANNVSSLISQMKDDPKFLSELENLVNVHNSDLIKNFRNDLPGLKEHYLRLFLFSVLGFSDSSISVFLNKTKTSMVWDMRRHLKDKINKLDTDRKTEYLEYLSK